MVTKRREHGSDSEARSRLPWRFVPAVVIAAGFAAFFLLGWDRHLSFEALRLHREELIAWCGDNPGAAGLSFVAVYALAVAFSVPGAVWMTIAGGFLFGPYVATLYVVAGATLGACGVFLAARYAFADALRRKAGPALRRMEKGFGDNALSYMLALRLVPLFPFWLVNLVPAFLGVPLRTFALGTLIGIVPGSFVYALVGNGLGSILDAGERPDLGIVFAPEVLAPLIGLAVLALLPVAYQWLRRSRA